MLGVFQTALIASKYVPIDIDHHTLRDLYRSCTSMDPQRFTNANDGEACGSIDASLLAARRLVTTLAAGPFTLLSQLLVLLILVPLPLSLLYLLPFLLLSRSCCSSLVP